jgi:hypothetical protein
VGGLEAWVAGKLTVDLVERAGLGGRKGAGRGFDDND